MPGTTAGYLTSACTGAAAKIIASSSVREAKVGKLAKKGTLPFFSWKKGNVPFFASLPFFAFLTSPP